MMPRAKHAKGRKCYVALFQGVLNVWKHLQKDGYPIAYGHECHCAYWRWPHGTHRHLRRRRSSTASHIWDSLLSEAVGHTAYSHQDDILEVDP